MSERDSSVAVPQEIAQAYYPQGISEHQLLAGGIVNSTSMITDTAGNKTILQKLSPIFDKSMAEDYAVVSEHLVADGWEVPEVVRTVDEDVFKVDSDDRLWRAFSFIESDGNSLPPVTIESATALSGLLGRLHGSLGQLDYTPKFSLTHFHETEFYAGKLEAMLPDIKDGQTRSLSSTMIELTRNNPIDQSDAQLIHGDPKMANALYRGGKPFTFIDWDTLMKASPMVDVGDMLRSVTGKITASDPEFTSRDLDPVIGAYYEAAKPLGTEAAFIKRSKAAGQVIALELGMRYAIDTVEDSYFDWDKENYSSRQEHNAARAQAQWNTYQTLAS